jgi:hypothetical protein
MLISDIVWFVVRTVIHPTSTWIGGWSDACGILVAPAKVGSTTAVSYYDDEEQHLYLLKLLMSQHHSLRDIPGGDAFGNMIAYM